ncbi:hypothetical protein HDU84_009371 [Entophlyctis sp. JEL0112]|nr:hypothetical protein HDU84_009371 [Entophlyctis sp. JEL0112]
MLDSDTATATAAAATASAPALVASAGAGDESRASPERALAPISFPSSVMLRIASAAGSGTATASTLITMACVCRAWCLPCLAALYTRPSLTLSDSFERLLAVLPLPVPVSRSPSIAGSEPFPYTYADLVQELDLCGAAADNLYIGDLDGALAMCSRSLRILRLGSVFHMSNMIVQSIATHCLGLLQLELPGCPVSDAFVPLLARKCIKLLRLDAAFTNLTVGSLIPIVKHAEALLELDLSECREPDSSLDLTPMVMHFCSIDCLCLSKNNFQNIRRPLKFLNLRNTQITDAILSFTVLHCPFLEILILESCSKLTDDSLVPIFSSCPNLRSLDVSFCDSISDKTINAISAHAEDMKSRGQFLKLEELYLTSCDLISPLPVHRMVTLASRLELLVLDGCESIVTSFIKSFAAKGEELECSLERQGLHELAEFSVDSAIVATNEKSGILSPPVSPVMQMHNLLSDLKVEVSYADQQFRGPENRLKGASAKMASTESTVYKALRESTTNVTVSRRMSTLRHRKSLLGLSTRTEDDDANDVLEAAKQERVEKIKEKRRSGNFFSSNRIPAQSSPSLSALDSHERFLASASIPRPSMESQFGSSTVLAPTPEEEEVDSKAAFLAAAAAKGLKIGAPQSSDGRTLRKRPSSILRADVAAFIPSSPPNDKAQLSEPTYVAPPPVNKDMEPKRRVSVGVPNGPPPPERAVWSTPTGISSLSINSAVSSPVLMSPSSAAPPPTITTPTGETGVLLFSGRKAAARQSLPPIASGAMASMPSLGSAPIEEEGSVVIASGRRRGRVVSMLEDSKAGANGSSAQSNAQASPGSLPHWATASALTPAVTPVAPWGTDPTVWNNPAQLTSASSTWNSAQSGVAQQFVDPWKGRMSSPPAPVQQHPGEPATSVLGPAPIINSLDPWAAPPPGAPKSVHHPGSVVSSATGGSPAWHQQQQQQQAQHQYQQQQHQHHYQTQQQQISDMSKTAGAPPGIGYPARPVAPSSRFGSVGSGGFSNLLSTPPGLMASPPGLGGTARTESAADAESSSDATPGDGREGFVYSVQNRGRLLLKLKIETKIGGEQMLAVHEYDDPQQLATEFVNYWELQAFKDPLVRLIAVRKTNVLRNRGALN